MEFRDYLQKNIFSKTIVGPAGSTTPRVYIVSNYPDHEDVINRQAFSSKECKDHLFRALEEAGVKLSECRMFYVSPYQPLDVNGRLRQLLDDEVRAFSKIMMADIDKYKPEVIICLGKTPAKAFGIDESIKAARHLNSDYKGIPLVITYNTGFIVNPEAGGHQSGNAFSIWVSDLRKAVNVKVEKSENKYEVIDVADCRRLEEIFPSKEYPLVLDYEASGFETMDKDFYVGGIGLYDVKAEKAVYVNLYNFLRLRDEYEVKMEDRMFIGKFLADRNIVVYNMQYECSATIGYFKHVLPRVTDVLQFARCAAESGSLKDVSSRKLNIPIWNDDVDTWVECIVGLCKEFKGAKNDKQEIKFLKNKENVQLFDLLSFFENELKSRTVAILNKSYKNYITNKKMDEAVGGAIKMSNKMYWDYNNINKEKLFKFFQETSPKKITYDLLIEVSENDKQFSQNMWGSLMKKRELNIIKQLKALEKLLTKYYSGEQLESIKVKLCKFFCDKADGKITDVNYCEIPFEIVSKYCINDVIYTGKLYNKFLEEFKEKGLLAASEVFNNQAKLAVELEQNGIAWDDDKAEDLAILYEEEAVKFGKSLLLSNRMRKILKITPQDELVINTATSSDTIKTYFNPDSTAVSSGVKKKFTQLLCTNRYKFAMIMYDVHRFSKAEKVPDNLAKKYPVLYALYKKVVAMTNQSEVLAFLEQAAASPDLRKKLNYKEAWLYNKYNSETFEFENLKSETLGEFYYVFKIIMKVDADELPSEDGSRKTWIPEFQALFDFRVLKKVLKARNTYIFGKLGRNNVYIINKKDAQNPLSERLDNLSYRKKTEDEVYINQSSFGVTTAATKRWKSGVHTVPSGCLHGDTEIVLSSNFYCKIKDLTRAGNFVVKSHTDFRSDSLKPTVEYASDARLTQRNAKCVKLHLSNGSSVICTPDHRFLTKDGKWKEARFLTESDILM